MNSRELIENTLKKENTGINAFWVGHPSDEAKEIYYKELGIEEMRMTALEERNKKNSVLLTKKSGKDEILFSQEIGSDMIWISPELDMSSWKHPEGKPMWDCFTEERESLGSDGIFADCEKVEEVERFPWPNPDYLDFTRTTQLTEYAYNQGLGVFGGMWCPFFHIVSDFFGMENYFIKMYTNPEVVHAVTRHVVDFLLEANKRCLDETKDYLSAAFFGNDLGTQLSLLISPDMFDKFVLPYIQEIIGGIKAQGLKVAMHSCGAIDMIIPRLIDAGVDILHPLQAKAAGMDAENLAHKYGGKLIFMGGVDTQFLLPFGSSSEVREEVLRLRDIFKGNFIVSPSHEALLPNVPFENVLAMSKAAKE